jgi:hypothetical protein
MQLRCSLLALFILLLSESYASGTAPLVRARPKTAPLLLVFTRSKVDKVRRHAVVNRVSGAGCSTTTSNLTLSGGAPGSFPTVNLNGSDQRVYTTLTSYTAANNTCSGWYITVQASRFTSAAGDTFPQGSLLMPPPTVSNCIAKCGPGATANPPAICITNSVALDTTSPVIVASAAVNTGNGTYRFAPGAIGSGNLQLTVPAYAYATTYTSTLTFSIIQGPASTC